MSNSVEGYTNRLNKSSFSDALDLLLGSGKRKERKFVETVELIVKLGIDPKQANQVVRGSATAPAGLGRKVRIVVVTADELLQESALNAGAMMAGYKDLISKIGEGFLDFDCCIASPDVMPALAKVAKKLGPKGLMPNPKDGNVTKDIVNVVERTLRGVINFRNDKYGIIHAGIGKVTFAKEDLLKNIDAMMSAIKSNKPELSKGKYIKDMFLTTTMGFCVSVSSI